VCTFIRMCVYVYLYTYVYVCIDLCIYLYVCMRIHIHMYEMMCGILYTVCPVVGGSACMHMCTSMSIYMCIWAYRRMYMCVNIYMCTYTYVYMR